MRNKRKERFDDFKYLYDTCKETFLKIAASNKSNEYFNDYYSLIIAPGGRWGGTDNRVIEIFYGGKAFDKKRTEKGGIELLKETGVTLIYQQHDNGFVTITYIPASTENFKVGEDWIMEDLMRDTGKLRDEEFIKKHFNNFVAYMEVTSLDGDPSIWQKFLVWKMRFFMFVNRKAQSQQPKFEEWGGKILRYVLTIGLSGFLLAVITYFKDKSTDRNSEKAIQEIRHEQIKTRQMLKKVLNDKSHSKK